MVHNIQVEMSLRLKKGWKRQTLRERKEVALRVGPIITEVLAGAGFLSDDGERKEGENTECGERQLPILELAEVLKRNKGRN